MSQKELKRMLSKLGVASRKDSEALIKAGRVTVNGSVVLDPLKPVNPTARILLDNGKIKAKQLEIYALNKPRGVVSTMAKDETRPKLADLMPKDQYLFPVGRLDKASRGLLLFTNDNDFADLLLSQKTKIEKDYRVQVKGAFSQAHLVNLRRGLEIDGIKYTAKHADVIRLNPRTSWLEIVLDEGKNREIRKLLKALGYEVLDLIRTRIGKLKLEDLDLYAGQYVQVEKDQIV